MIDVNSGANPEGPGVRRVPDDPLLQACEEFWDLIKFKHAHILGEEARHTNRVSLEEVDLLQTRLAEAFKFIRRARANNPVALYAKYKVLKHEASAVEYQDPDIFRAAIDLLDEFNNWYGQPTEGICPAAELSSDEKKRWKFNINNIFGLFHN